MNQIVTQGIVLSRTNYGEADRIVSMITPDDGKISLMAKGVRRVKSKLAGGIELFCVSEVTYIQGKSDLHTLVSTRLKTNYGTIVQDINRTMLGYELLKRLNRATEDAAEAEYFELLSATLKALDDGVDAALLELWFDARLLLLAGHQPNLITDVTGKKLSADARYTFDFESMAFAEAEQGPASADHIKFLRLVFRVENPAQLQQVADAAKVVGLCAQLVNVMRREYIRI